MVRPLDFKSEEELAVAPSPFAIASLIQLRKLQTGNNVQQRYTFKLSLARALYRRGHQREDLLKGSFCWPARTIYHQSSSRLHATAGVPTRGHEHEFGHWYRAAACARQNRATDQPNPHLEWTRLLMGGLGA